MSKPQAPKTIEEATALLERHAELEGKIATVNGRRDRIIAKAKAAADKAVLPVIAELATIDLQLEPWWKKNAGALTAGKRKSMVIGGCTIGTKLSRTVLTLPEGGEEVAIEKLQTQPWGKGYVVRTVSYALDKAAALAALKGKHADRLKALGFAKEGGEDEFFVKRAALGGTIGA